MADHGAAARPSIDTDPIKFLLENWEAAGQPQAEYHAAAALVFRLHQQISSTFERALKPNRISRSAYHLMTTLYMSENMTRPLGQLSKNILMHATTVTLIIDQLEKRDLVRRASHPTDRRTTLATLTPAGAQLVMKCSAALAEVQFGLHGVDEATVAGLTANLRHIQHDLDSQG
jgi:DNA-binding MarR family transcriptional regulator